MHNTGGVECAGIEVYPFSSTDDTDFDHRFSQIIIMAVLRFSQICWLVRGFLRLARRGDEHRCYSQMRWYGLALLGLSIYGSTLFGVVMCLVCPTYAALPLAYGYQSVAPPELPFFASLTGKALLYHCPESYFLPSGSAAKYLQQPAIPNNR